MMATIEITKESFFIAAILGFFVRFVIQKIPSFWLHSLLNLPGTIAHETSHAIVSIFTFGKMTRFSIIPRRAGDKWVFGSIECANLNNFNAFPIAMAPLILLATPYFLGEIYAGHQLNVYFAAALWSITGIVCQASVPSAQDFKVAFTYWLGTFAWIGLIAFYLFPEQVQGIFLKII
ncbi:hypothetical protein [Hydrogenovibrio marinus]|uniref:Uncharacterized protein n=1 Tax=Hydrogenovibrio marinus TaxID=28885 RepID=A0A066ZLM0_HYDMR|nr:hypothetical protein [Hydrogenovibrio marinus]KDN94678.1 hypothetical protein EI16_12325 [Hydrogenovibrio marinus]